MVQWLGLHASTAQQQSARGQSPVKSLRSCKPSRVSKKKKRKEKKSPRKKDIKKNKNVKIKECGKILIIWMMGMLGLYCYSVYYFKCV